MIAVAFAFTAATYVRLPARGIAVVSVFLAGLGATAYSYLIWRREGTS